MSNSDSDTQQAIAPQFAQTRAALLGFYFDPTAHPGLIAVQIDGLPPFYAETNSDADELAQRLLATRAPADQL